MFECHRYLVMDYFRDKQKYHGKFPIDRIGKIKISSSGMNIIDIGEMHDNGLTLRSVWLEPEDAQKVPLEELVKLNPAIKIEWTDIAKDQQPMKLRYFKGQIEEFTELFDKLEELRKKLPVSGYNDLIWYYLGKAKFQVMLAFSAMCEDKD